jgi:hypothetical protein
MTRMMIAAAVVLFLLTAVHATQCGDGPELKEPAVCSRLFGFQGLCGKPNYARWLGR